MDARILNGQLVAYQYRPDGGGPCVVFANSLGSDQSLWDGVIAALPRGFDTLTYDLRGHGQSGQSGEFRIHDLADDLIALLDHLELSDVVLCGLSVGGMVAQSLAVRRPDLLRGLILSNTAPRIGTNARWDDRIEAVTEGGVSKVADAILANWFAPSYWQNYPERFAMHRSMLSRTPTTGYAAMCAAIRDADLTADVSAIGVPTLCIAGADDQSVTPAQVLSLSQQITGAQCVVMDNVGHLPAFEAPKDVARLIETMATSPASRFDQGMAVRRAVLGDRHVDSALKRMTALDQPFQTLTTEAAWGTVWSSPGLTRRERSMLTLALLAATGNFDEIAMHVRATQRTGASAGDIQETFQHVAIYAGVPRANHALRIARETLAELEEGHE